MSIKFDGATAAVSVPDSVSWDFGSGDVTIHFRVKFNALKDTFFVHHRPSPFPGGTFGLEIYYNHSIKYLIVNYNNTTAACYSPWTPGTGIWYDIIYRRSGSSHELLLNGASMAIISDSGSFGAANGPINFGDYIVGGYFLNGWMEEVAIWKGYYITDTEVIMLNSGIRGMPLRIQPANLEGYWPMNEMFDGEDAHSDNVRSYSWKNDGTAANTIFWSADSLLANTNYGQVRIYDVPAVFPLWRGMVHAGQRVGLGGIA